jgi:dTDP-glucose pyrophosphorylase
MNAPRGNDKTDKVVILARGLGTRMRQADDGVVLDAQQEAMAAAGAKAMISIGRPFLDYVLASLADSGYGQVCLVVGPEHHSIRDYYGRQLQPERLSITFAVQAEPRGTADAVAAAEPFVADDFFVVLNSDNYYPREALESLRDVPGPGTALFDEESMVREGNIASDRLAKFALGLVNAEGFLEQIIEKPDPVALEHWPRPRWLSMNCWRFSPKIFQACHCISPSPRGELELPIAVEYSMRVLGEKYRAVKVHAAVLDLTSRADIAAVKAALQARQVNL